MRVALIHNAVLPTFAYGGTERVLWGIARGLSERGVGVVIVAARGTQCPFAEVKIVDFSKPIAPQLSKIDGVHIEHHFSTPPKEPSRPYLVGIHGNGRIGEKYFQNTVFVSRNHAERHGATCFVHNGINPDEYRFQEKKEERLLFLAKASWRVKNVKGAGRIARAAKLPLHIVGGKRFLFKSFRGVHWRGVLGGVKKAEEIATAKGLLFPVIWNEPFGIAVIEALVSGTPVLASRHGSLPELVGPEVGILSNRERDLVEGARRLSDFSAKRCREWALARFHYRQMAEGYLALYEKLLNKEALNPKVPQASEPPDTIYPLDRE